MADRLATWPPLVSTGTDPLSLIQAEHREWSRRNFGEYASWRPLLGAVEELGELARATLKMIDGIRTGEDHAAAKRDAVGDVLLFLCGFCTAEGIDITAALEETWDRVRLRDWKADPVSAGGVSVQASARAGG